MANTGVKGIDVRQTGTALVFRVFMQTSAGAKETAGPVALSIYELQSDGTLKSYDFNDNTFKTTALTTATASMTHQKGNNATVNTGIWTYALSTLTGFTSGAIYIAQTNDASASPTDQTREFQFGGAEGDLAVTANGTGVAEINTDVRMLLGTAWLTPSVAGTPDVNVKSVGGTAQTARDLGNALPAAAPGANGGLPTVDANNNIHGLTPGTGTGQINAASGKVPATLASTDVTGNIPADLQTIKTQAVTCLAGVTIGAFVGNATHAIAVDTNGAVTFNNTSIATVTTVTNAVTLPTIPTNWITATGIAASALNGKGDWLLASSAPTNFSTLGIGANGHISNVDTLTTYTGNTPQTGDVYGYLTTALTESYAAKGSAPTLAQLCFEIRASMCDFQITSTTLTARKLDGATAAATYTLDSSTPTSRTRAT